MPWPRSRPRDQEGNALAAAWHVLLDTRGTLVATADPQHLIAAIGCEDLVIVHTPDATLVCRKDRAEDVKRLCEIVAERYGEAYRYRACCRELGCRATGKLRPSARCRWLRPVAARGNMLPEFADAGPNGVGRTFVVPGGDQTKCLLIMPDRLVRLSAAGQGVCRGCSGPPRSRA